MKQPYTRTSEVQDSIAQDFTSGAACNCIHVIDSLCEMKPWYKDQIDIPEVPLSIITVIDRATQSTDALDSAFIDLLKPYRDAITEAKGNVAEINGLNPLIRLLYRIFVPIYLDRR